MKLKKGMRVCVVGKKHDKGHRCGVIREVAPQAFGIAFDGMRGKIHRWYAARELRRA